MLTYKKVNQILHPTGFELVQGNGYLYFWTIDQTLPLLRYESIAVCKLNHADIEFIILELESKVIESWIDSSIWTDEIYIKVMQAIKIIKQELNIKDECYMSESAKHYFTLPKI